MNPLRYAERLLSIRPRSEKEIRERMERKGYSPQEIEKTVNHFKNIGLLDDREFAKWWFEERKGERGIFAIKMELKRKGVSDEIIDEVVSGDEREFIKKALEKAERKYKNLPERERKRKIREYLLRRGFSWDVIQEVTEWTP